MDMTRTEVVEGCAVLPGAVSLVTGKSIAGVRGLEGHQQPITGHLGDDRGGGDGKAQGIAFDDALLGQGELGKLQGINEQKNGWG